MKKITEIHENQLFLMLKITEIPLITGTLSPLPNTHVIEIAS